MQIVRDFKVESKGVGGQDYAQAQPGAAQPTALNSTTYTLQDMSELAARLGSPATFDRRGEVVWMDDFEDGLKWGTPVAGDMILTPHGRATYAEGWGGYKGFLCMRLRVTTTKQATAYIPQAIKGKIGYCMTFSAKFTDALFGYTIFDYVTFGMDIYVDGYLNRPRIRYTASGNMWSYIDDAFTTYQNIGVARLVPDVFNSIKFVVDPHTHQYERLMINSAKEFDLRDFKVFHSASVYPFGAVCSVEPHEEGIAQPYNFDVDSFVLTQNEPAGGS